MVDAPLARPGLPGPRPAARSGAGQRGAGLVEALVALVLLATALATAAAGLLQAHRQGQAGLLRLQAAESVADAAERLRLAAASGVPAAPLLATWQAGAAATLPAAQAGVAVIAGPAEPALLAHRSVQLAWLAPAGPEHRTLSVTLALAPDGAAGTQAGLP